MLEIKRCSEECKCPLGGYVLLTGRKHTLRRGDTEPHYLRFRDAAQDRRRLEKKREPAAGQTTG